MFKQKSCRSLAIWMVETYIKSCTRFHSTKVFLNNRHLADQLRVEEPNMSVYSVDPGFVWTNIHTSQVFTLSEPLNGYPCQKKIDCSCFQLLSSVTTLFKNFRPGYSEKNSTPHRKSIEFNQRESF